MIRYTPSRRNAWITSCAGPGTLVSACGRFAGARDALDRKAWLVREIHAPNVAPVWIRTFSDLLAWLDRFPTVLRSDVAS